jgi:glycosyl transferase family 1
VEQQKKKQETELEVRDARIQSLEAEVAACKAFIQSSEAGAACRFAAEEQLSAPVGGRAEQNEEVSVLRAKLAAAEAQLDSVLGSMSWRLTGPLRDLEGRHPVLVARSRRLLSRRPNMRQVLLEAAKRVWRSATLQLLGRAKGQPRAIRAPAIEARSQTPPDLPVFDLHPIATSEGPAQLFRSNGPRLICISHVMPFPPQAGNEYRLHRMLRWLAERDWDILLVISPLSNDPLSERRLTEATKIYQNLIVCQRDGGLYYRLADGGAMLEGLSGRRARVFAPLLGEAEKADDRENRLLTTMRLSCPDLLVELLLHLEAKFDPQVLLAECVFMARSFTVLRPGLCKIIDTINRFSTGVSSKAGAPTSTAEDEGIEEDLTLDPGMEAELLNRADLLIAVQEAEADVLRKLAPDRRVIKVGVDFTLLNEVPPLANKPVILLVASRKARNVKGLKDFLRFAWPLIRRELREAELRVIGSVGEAVETVLPGIQILGCLEDLAAAYAEARVIINPAVSGTGLKIKTVEALCHLRPIVLWPSGVDGLEPEISQLCHIASNWFEFARHVIRLAGEKEGAQELNDRRATLEQRFAPETVYALLGAALEDKKDDAGELQLSPQLDPLRLSSRGP